jgi:hypothetical protein
LVELPAQVEVAEQLLGQLRQLRALLGRHRIEHRLHRRHPRGDRLEQLVERLRVLREHVAVLLHELLELRIFSALTSLEHLVERRQHVLHPLHVGGRHALHRPRHPVDDLLHQLLAKTVLQLFEAPRCLARLERVGVELAHLAGEVVGHQVESQSAVGGCLSGSGGAALVAAPLTGPLGRVDGVALLVDDVVELAVDLVVDTTEVVLVEPLLTLLTDAVHQLAQPLQPLTVAVAQPLLHHPPQGGVHVSVVEQLVGELGEQVLRIELEPRLAAIPTRVREAGGHDRTLLRTVAHPGFPVDPPGSGTG